MSENIEYGIDACAYLARAHARLSSNHIDDLFYAAFELRCSIEKRQAEYMTALERYYGSKFRRWKIGETSRHLHQVWDDPKIASIVFQFDDGIDIQTYYTPVTQSLVQAAERDLGEMLHSMDIERGRFSSWLAEKRCRLVEIYREAWIACQGQHMAPPLWDASTKQCHPFHLIGGMEVKQLFDRIELDPNGYGKFILKIDYLDAPPSNWKCDL